MNISIVIPIYKETLNPFEEFSVQCTLERLAGLEAFFIHPSNLKLKFYEETYPSAKYMPFDPQYFTSIWTYNRLCLESDLYRRFEYLDYILLVQTDAIVVKDDLNYWAGQGFDYIGAPDPTIYNFNLSSMPPFNEFLIFKSFPTWSLNGGFSLRRPSAFLSVIKEYSDLTTAAKNAPIGEDYFYTMMGSLSKKFKVPNLIMASGFARDGMSEGWDKFGCSYSPMGYHKWFRDYESIRTINGFVGELMPPRLLKIPI